MKTILDILLFPLSPFIEAFVGILFSPESAKMRTHRRVALISLVGCVGMFGTAIVLSAIDSASVAMVPLMLFGLVPMFAFLIAGKACADEAENSNRRDGS